MKLFVNLTYDALTATDCVSESNERSQSSSTVDVVVHGRLVNIYNDAERTDYSRSSVDSYIRPTGKWQRNGTTKPLDLTIE